MEPENNAPDSTTWVTLSEIHKGLEGHPNGGSLARSALERAAAHGLLKIRVQSARLTGRENSNHTAWVVPQDFLSPDGVLSSGATIDISQNMIRCAVHRHGPNAILTRLEGIGLAFDKDGLEFAFPGILASSQHTLSVNPIDDDEGASQLAGVGTHQAEQSKGSRGRKTNKDGWIRFAAAVAVWVHTRDDDAAGIVEVGPDEFLTALDDIAMNRLPRQIQGNLPRSTYQDGAYAILDAFRSLAGK